MRNFVLVVLVLNLCAFLVGCSMLTASKPVATDSLASSTEEELYDKKMYELLHTSGVMTIEDFQKDVTREEFASWMLNVYKRVAVNYTPAYTVVFTDTDSKIISEAASAGLINGMGEGIFNPSGPITRQEAGVIFYNVLAKLGMATDQVGSTTLADEASMAEWAKNCCLYTVGVGALTTNDGMFEPLKNIKAYEMVKYLERFLFIAAKSK